jgi:hypothetical protein
MKDAEVEETVAQRISQGVFDAQREFTSLPYGTIDANSPYAPPSLSQILGKPSPKDRSGTGTVILCDAQLLTHSHLITYGGEDSPRFLLQRCFSFAYSHSFDLRNLLFLSLRKTSCCPNLEYSLQS